MTNYPTLLDALRDIAEHDGLLLYERAAKDGVFKLIRNDVWVNTTSERNRQDIFFMILDGCKSRNWRWLCGQLFPIGTGFWFEVEICPVGGGLVQHRSSHADNITHAAVLAFRKAIMAEHTEQPPVSRGADGG